MQTLLKLTILIILVLLVRLPAYSEVTLGNERDLAAKGARMSRLPYSERKKYFPGKYVLEETASVIEDKEGYFTIQSFGNEDGGLWKFCMVYSPDVTNMDSGVVLLSLSPHDQDCKVTKFENNNGETVYMYTFKRFDTNFATVLYLHENGYSFGFKGNSLSKIIHGFKSRVIYTKIKERLQKYLDAGWCEP
ncbi:MAG: hypothetical protein K2O24_03100 [Muribaculaceae bacterium]|nr:hypothetical protein [Muribaculaceae bacterium]